MVKDSLWFTPFKEGDKAAMRQLYKECYKAVCYYAFQFINDEDYAGGIVSETFSKAWDQRTRFNTEKHLKNFLYRVTKNECLKKLRDDKVIERTVEEWVRLTQDEITTRTALDDERAKTLMIETVMKELDKLHGGAALRMSYLQGMTTKEISRDMNTTENNVYIMKSRSLKELKARLGHWDWLFIVGLFLATGVITEDLLQQANLSSIEKHAIDLTGVPAAFLWSGQAGDRHECDRSLADAFPLAAAKRVR